MLKDLERFAPLRLKTANLAYNRASQKSVRPELKSQAAFWRDEMFEPLNFSYHKTLLEKKQYFTSIAFQRGSCNKDFGIVTKNLKSFYAVLHNNREVLRTRNLEKAITKYNSLDG